MRLLSDRRLLGWILFLQVGDVIQDFQAWDQFVGWLRSFF